MSETKMSDKRACLLKTLFVKKYCEPLPWSQLIVFSLNFFSTLTWKIFINNCQRVFIYLPLGNNLDRLEGSLSTFSRLRSRETIGAA